MKGQFWVIEGTDGAGKSTQAALLAEHLEKLPYFEKHSVIRWHFPHYEGHPWGTLIQEYLHGELGEVNEVGPHYAGLLYAADRGQQSPAIQAALARGDWVLADRYMGSNLAHQGAKIADLTARKQYQAWLEKLEFEYFNIARPTGTFFLSVSQNQQQKQLSNRESFSKKGPDIHEKDVTYLTNVAQEYSALAERLHWQIIHTTAGENSLTPTSISESIWKFIEPNLT